MTEKIFKHLVRENILLQYLMVYSRPLFIVRNNKLAAPLLTSGSPYWGMY